MNKYVIQDKVLNNLPPPYRQMHIFRRAKGYFSEFHSHDNFYHVSYIESGEVIIGFKDNDYTIKEGQAVIMPPRVPHSIYSKTGYSQIGIDIFEMDDERGIYDLFSKTYPSGFAVITLAGFTKSYRELYQTFRFVDNKLNYLKIINTVETLILTIIEHSKNVMNPNFKQRFIDFIQTENAFAFPLEKICQHMSVSKTHLERLVKKEFGCGVIEYVNQIKLSKACMLLHTTDLHIKTISEDLQFYDSSHFNYFFKRRMNITPSQYRTFSRNEQ